MPLIRADNERFDAVPDFPYEPEYIDVGDHKMAYVDIEGSGEETFLCLHGEPTWSFLYRKMIPTLTDRGRVVAPDAIGFGQSDKYDDPAEYSFDLHYESLVELIEGLALDEITLVCQDWGGILGLTIAGHHPGRFARLVAMNTGLPDGTNGMPEVWHDFREVVATAPELNIAELIDGGCLTDLSEGVRAAYEAPFPSEESKAGVRAWPELIPLEPDQDGADRISAARETLGTWEKPAFVLFSDSDPITGPAAADLRGLIPTASGQPETWIEGAGHFLQEDSGEEVATEIVEFVDRT